MDVEEGLKLRGEAGNALTWFLLGFFFSFFSAIQAQKKKEGIQQLKNKKKRRREEGEKEEGEEPRKQKREEKLTRNILGGRQAVGRRVLWCWRVHGEAGHFVYFLVDDDQI